MVLKNLFNVIAPSEIIMLRDYHNDKEYFYGKRKECPYLYFTYDVELVMSFVNCKGENYLLIQVWDGE